MTKYPHKEIVSFLLVGITENTSKTVNILEFVNTWETEING